MDNDSLFFIPSTQAKFANKREVAKAQRSAGASTLHTSDLTQTIIKYIRARGGYAVRINCFGMYNEKTSCWRKSTTERGTADIHACIEGKHISVEIKYGKDGLSDRQRQVQKSVTDAGGVYLIVHEFIEFHAWYKNQTAR